MGSSRLPGKVLHPVAGKPLLGHLLDRLALARRLDGVIVATSQRPENDAIEAYCRSRGTPCFRGDEDDVLGRMLGALRARNATVGVTVFGDCPLIDPAIVDHMVEVFQQAGGCYDFVGNDLRTTYPPGMEVEVYAMAAFEDSAQRCTDPAIREHGTLYIRQNPDRYRLCSVEAPPELHRPELELEIDTAEDLLVLGPVLEQFPAGTPLAEVIAFLDAHPDLAAANRDVPRRWKEFRDDA
jgi:spore coat polysaccharide biosynthesis protein SpsF (cytidylyltransferase family)